MKMMNAASTLNPSFILEVGEAYPYPSHVSAPNFVTMKLSSKDTYNVWETQILCLLMSHHMFGFVEGQFPWPARNGKGKEGDIDAWIASDSLVKGWILGSLSDGVAKKVVNRLKHKQKKTDFTAKDLWGYQKQPIHKKTDFTAKDLWDELQRSYGPSDREQAAVGCSTKNHELLKELLEMTPKENTLIDLTNSNGSTLLHVAAIGGNIEAVNMLVERNPELLLVKDKEGHTPLALSVSNMHNKTSKCLFEHMEVHGYGALFEGQSGEELVVLAISCQDFRLARRIIHDYPGAILSNSDAVLMTLAQNFPGELNYWERRRDLMDEVEDRLEPYTQRLRRVREYFNRTLLSLVLVTLLHYFIYGFYCIVTAFSLFLKAIVHPFIKDTYHVYKDAESLLGTVCFKIHSKYYSSTYHKYYNNSIFEATRQNSSTFIREIMRWFPDAIWSANEDGHNFIQYSVINRSEKIYNLLYEMSEHKNIYKTIKDYSGNNLLHLAARLAPANKLNRISGAALQIQRELQWFKEVERFVCPLNWIQKNSDDETPQMVFTREHKDQVIEGENWIKKTAESYTITAALIITIVFAAAITVPGGNNQDSGIPIFTNNIAFTVFAISDAISLFTAVTSLLMFLSILTARFAEQDFLYKLPTKLIIGLTMLFLSTTAMIIAFGATLFLVFGQSNMSMLIPIGALTCLPITSFVTLQCPLIVELISATYGGGIFVREEYKYLY